MSERRSKAGHRIRDIGLEAETYERVVEYAVRETWNGFVGYSAMEIRTLWERCWSPILVAAGWPAVSLPSPLPRFASVFSSLTIAARP